MTIAEKLKDLPTAAGIYIHKNAAGKIIYVGKAKNLRSRVRQYFQSSRNLDPKTRNLVKLIAVFEFIVVDNEVERHRRGSWCVLNASGCPCWWSAR